MKTPSSNATSSSRAPDDGARRRAIAIGSGVGGMAAAIRMRLQGYSVSVFESASMPGGKVGEHRHEGWRFDTGPSLFTLPELLDELFRDAGADPGQYYQYHRLDNICRYFFPDGKVLNAWSDPEKMAQEFEHVLAEPAANIHRYLHRAARIYELTRDIFLTASLHDLETWRRAPWIKTILGLPELDALSTMNNRNRRLFQQPNTVMLFNRYATYNGSNPYKAPATLNVIGHLEHNLGAYFLRGGMRNLIEAMHRLALEIGVEFEFDSPVERILVQGKKVEGVQLSARAPQALRPADVVISNMDVVPSYRKLLPGIAHPERLLSQPKSTSALIFYWSMKKSWPIFDLHNILFSSDYALEFHHLCELKTLQPDPTVYLYISSKAEPSDAPPGGENWFVMINVPHLNGQNWDELIARARERIITKLESQTGQEIRSHISAEKVLDPRGIAEMTSSHLGALYGNSSDNPMAAFLRHPNFSRSIRGLYFCGGSVHPGGGIPLCLLSARIAAEQAAKRQD